MELLNLEGCPRGTVPADIQCLMCSLLVPHLVVMLTFSALPAPCLSSPCGHECILGHFYLLCVSLIVSQIKGVGCATYCCVLQSHLRCLLPEALCQWPLWLWLQQWGVQLGRSGLWTAAAEGGGGHAVFCGADEHADISWEPCYLPAGGECAIVAVHLCTVCADCSIWAFVAVVRYSSGQIILLTELPYAVQNCTQPSTVALQLSSEWPGSILPFSETCTLVAVRSYLELQWTFLKHT